MANEYYERLSEMNPGDLADGLAMEAEFDAIAQGFSKLPTPHTGGQGFDGPVRVGDAVNADEAVNKGQLDNALGTAKLLPIATYGDFNAAVWAVLPSGSYLLFGTGSQFSNAPWALTAAKTYSAAVRHVIGDAGVSLYLDEVVLSSTDDTAHVDIGRPAYRLGQTLAGAYGAGWNGMPLKRGGDTATGDILGITAPQFTNDKKFATTEFVQRALGNMSGYANYTTSTTLTTADAGKYVIFSVSGPATCTLPNPATLPNGTTFTVEVTGGELTVTATGATGTTFVGPSMSASASSYKLPAFGMTQFIVIEGQYRVAIGVGKALLSANGYQKLPSGLIIQWGRGTIAGGGASSATVTFPIAFPTNSLAGLAVVSNHTTPTVYMDGAPISASQMMVRSNAPTGAGGIAFTYVVFGY